MTLRVVTDLSDSIIDRLPAAQDAGLLEAARVYQETVQRALAEGYTTGQYTTGAAARSVDVRGPSDGAAGRTVSIGTDLDYPTYWELGFQHAGNGQYYRVETWRPALDSAADEMRDAFNAGVLSVLTQGAE